MGEFSVIGKPIPRVDALDKVTGGAIYGVDFKLPAMLHGKILRSPVAHARILNIDISRAERVPGVRAVITGKDGPGIKFGFFKHGNHKFGDKLPLEIEKVRFIGDEVAAVAAIDEETAEEAIDLIKIDYEELPAVFDVEAALRPDAPLIHDDIPGNFVPLMVQAGDVEAAFAASDVVYEHRYSTPAVTPSPLEPIQCVAAYDSSGRLTVWSSTQMPFYLREHLADCLGVSEAKVRVLKTTMGAGFGRRMEMHPADPIAALLARKSGRPVRIVHTREEEFVGARFRHPMYITVKVGAKKDGTLLASQMLVLSDSGAYISQAPGVTAVAGHNCMSMYRMANVKFDAKIVYTNNPYAGSFRGYGNPQGTFAMESAIDVVAEKLGIDACELRLKNSNQPNSTTALGQRITSCGSVECLEKAADRIGWKEKRGKPGNRGVGLAGLFHVGGGARVHGDSDGAGAMIKMDDDGTVTLMIGTQEIGQGSMTILTQIVAEELGVRIQDVRIANTDTDVMPWDLGTHASRSTFVGGNAALLAAREAKKKLVAIAAQKLEASPEDIEVREGRISLRSDPARGMSVSEAATASHFRRGGPVIMGSAFYDPPTDQPEKGTGYGNKSGTYAFGAQAAEVEVDEETGKVKIIKMVAAHDVGRTLNPLTAEGQVEGAVVQGIGWALTEEMQIKDGQVLNPNLVDYRMPTMADLPETETILVETIDPLGPFGAKGLGESGLVPTAPAIANAVYDAVGVRIHDLPITPEKVLRALAEKRASEGKGA